MCGRFTITMSAPEIETLLENDFDIKGTNVDEMPRFNIAPTQRVLGLLSHYGKYRFGSLKWGLKFSSHLAINTRIETIQEKDYFKDLMTYQKILILSNGYFEWDKDNKTPYYIHYENQEPMFYGGLWRKNNDVFECSIITLEAPKHLKEIHPRMPFSMKAGNAKKWLVSEGDPYRLVNPPNQFYVISNRVNKVSENDRDILKETDGTMH